MWRNILFVLLAHVAGSYCVLLFDRINNYGAPGLSFLSWIFAPFWLLPELIYLTFSAVAHGNLLEAIPFIAAYQLPFDALILYGLVKWIRRNRSHTKGFPLYDPHKKID